MKEYQVKIYRGFTTYITLKFPNDGRNHEKIINEKIREGNEEIWEHISYEELEQCNVDNEGWEITEINNTTTGPVFPDWTLHTKYDKNGK